MAKLVFGMNQSLDGYVDHDTRRLRQARCSSAISSSRCASRRAACTVAALYEVMRYWDEDHPEWDAEEREFATAWRGQPKWVVSRSLTSVGPNATLVEDDLEAAMRGLKASSLGRLALADPTWREVWATLVSSMSIGSTSTPSCSARQAILRGPAAAAPPCGQRANWRGRDQVDVRSCVSTWAVPAATMVSGIARFWSRKAVQLCSA